MSRLVGCSLFHLRRAVGVIAAGGVVAYPTEAVFGLGCDPWCEAAVLRLLDIKARPVHKGLILIGSEYAQLAPFVAEVEAERMAAVQASWPGPFTWLLPARPETPYWLTGAHPTLAVRVTAHPIAAALCRAWGQALVSTSANRSTHPPARTPLAVRLRLGDALDYLLPGACGPSLRPSRIRDARTGALVRA